VEHYPHTGRFEWGSAAAVAVGMAAAALGSDGSGSIRVPSSFCGVYGLKPSFGRVPLYPGCRDERFPGFSAWESVERIGPITRHVHDAALLLDVIAGPDPRDRHSLPAETSPFAEIHPDTADVRGLRIAWSLDLGGYARVDSEVRDAVEWAAARFAALGALITRVTHTRPFSTDPGEFFETVVAMDADLPSLRQRAAERPGQVNTRIAAMLAREWTSDEVARSNAGRQTLYNQLWRFFDDYDLLLTPTTPVAAFDIDRRLPLAIDGDADVPGHALSWFTLPFNLTGNPAASLPCGWTADGLPIGLQLVANHLDDRTVLRASAAFEREINQTPRWPSSERPGQ
jgi:aspartyl-tRNA(Asn)/glutamyl-tRNA(Gln) amidotransferase subunit A